jgi:hypothetical protein
MPEEAPSGRGGVRGHRPSDRSVRPGLVAAPALLNALIHRSAWKGYSAKFRYEILHNTGPMRALRHIPDVGEHTRRHYMLWQRIKMRRCE